VTFTNDSHLSPTPFSYGWHSLYKFSAFDDEKFYAFLLLMAQQQVGNRPGRIEPRAVKRRPKAFPLLTKPRDMARENVRLYGHPKKLK
jgi:hypothetical protein